MESRGSDLIPGLPDDLALLCFAYLPRRLHPLASCVSRAWKHAFQSHALLSLRRELGTLDTWLLLCLTGDNRDEAAIYTLEYIETYKWWVIDPALCPQSHPIPLPPYPNYDRGFFNYDVFHDVMAAAVDQGEVLLTANLKLDSPMEEICRLDMVRKRWLRPSPPNMLASRMAFASASLDGYVYVAGGDVPEHRVPGHDYSSNFTPFKSVERLDCKTMSSWERLPDMHVARTLAGGVVLNGCFCVIGGYMKGGDGKPAKIYSGEIWDPRSQKWILEPELWPYDVFKKSSNKASRNVAVVMGSLFAIKQDWKDKMELMRYDNATKIWTSLGCFPIESFLHDSKLADYSPEFFTCKLFGIGKELWVLLQGAYGYDMFMVACSPLLGQSVSWRRLPYSLPFYKLVVGIAVSV